MYETSGVARGSAPDCPPQLRVLQGFPSRVGTSARRPRGLDCSLATPAGRRGLPETSPEAFLHPAQEGELGAQDRCRRRQQERLGTLNLKKKKKVVSTEECVEFSNQYVVRLKLV